jgi:hypothetical protein
MKKDPTLATTAACWPAQASVWGWDAPPGVHSLLGGTKDGTAVLQRHA